MKKGKKLYEGKAKIIYATTDKNLVIQHFKDDATAFNNQKNLTWPYPFKFYFLTFVIWPCQVQVSDKHLKQPILEASGQLLEIG